MVEDWRTFDDVDECAEVESVREGECGGKCKNTIGERKVEIILLTLNMCSANTSDMRCV